MSPTRDDPPSPLVILLTGRPGSGKTTVVRQLAELLSGRGIAGFYTAEIREAGRRQGFGVSTFSGATGILAHVQTRSPHRVGRYGVDVHAFERIVLTELARAAEVFLIDEIGKMECFSQRFVAAMRALLAGQVPVVATVAQSGSGFIAEVRRRPDVELWEVTAQRRDALPGQLAERVVQVLGCRPGTGGCLARPWE